MHASVRSVSRWPFRNEALTAAGCEKIYSEKRSGRTAKHRPELAGALDELRPGDQVMVTQLDRLARSVGDLHRIVEQITARVPPSAVSSGAAWIRPAAPAS